MKYAVIGSRSFDDYNRLSIICDKFISNNDTIVSGGAYGADFLAKEYSKINNINYVEYLPDWDLHGKSAGPIRNKIIVSDSDFVIAFWDGKSKGTKSSIDIAKEQKKPTLIIYV